MSIKFLYISLALVVGGCVELSENSVTTQPKTSNSSNVILENSTAQQDYDRLTGIGQMTIIGELKAKCGNLFAPYVETSAAHVSSKSAREQLKRAELHAKNLPNTKACYQSNTHPIARQRANALAEMELLTESIRNKMARGGYDTNEPGYSGLKVRVKYYETDEMLESELAVVNRQFTSADTQAQDALKNAMRASKIGKAKSAAIWNAAISGAVNNGAFSMSRELDAVTANVNAARASANLPQILTEEETQQLQSAYRQSIINGQNATSETASGGSSDSQTGAFTLSSSQDWDCDDPTDYSSPCTANIARREQERAAEEKRMAEFKAHAAEMEKQRKLEDAQNAREDAERRAQNARKEAERREKAIACNKIDPARRPASCNYAPSKPTATISQ
jgi:hypothetical protein